MPMANGFSTTTSSTVQPSSSAAPAFQFAVIDEMYTCGVAEVRWTYSSPSPMSFNITNVDVVQQAPMASSVANTGQSITSGAASATRSVTQRDVSKRPYSSYGGSYLPPIEEQLATQLDPLVGIWRWSSVNVPQGWYRMVATVQDVFDGSSSSFFVQNDTNVDCILQISQTSSTSTTTTTGTSSMAISHTSFVAGGIIGGAAAVILVIGAIAFVRRRRRQDHMRKIVGPSFSNALMGAGSEVIVTQVTPFNPTLTDTSPLDAGSQIDREQQRSDHVGTSTFPLNPEPSSSGPLLQSSLRAVPIHVRLSSKELARLRSSAAHTQLIPAESSSSGSQPTPPPVITAGQGEPTPARAIQSEVENLRREVEQVRAQQVRAEIFEAPPSYGEA